MFKLIIKPKAKKGLRKLHSKDRKKVFLVLKEFNQSPYNKKFNITKLIGFKNLEKAFRLRIGNIRVIYELHPKQKQVIIYLISYRTSTTY